MTSNRPDKTAAISMAKSNQPKLTGEISAARFVEGLEAYRSPAELRKYHRYFKFDEDRPGDGDQFMGVRAETMGQWVYPYTSDERDECIKQIVEASDTLLYGRTTYEIHSPYWSK